MSDRDEHTSPDVALAVAQQQARAAERLWTGGHRAEALRLARAALRSTLDAADAGLVGDTPWRAALQTALSDAPSPRLDRDVAPAHIAWFATAQNTSTVGQRALSRTILAPRDARNRRVLQRVVAGSAVLAVLAVLLGVRARTTIRAVASAENRNGNGYPARFAVDDDPATEWILPDGATGYLDLLPSRPMRLHAVRILNAHNGPWNNVAVHDWRLEAYAGERRVGTAEGSFPRLDASPASIRIRLDAVGVTRVRLVVVSVHGSAGGVAEVYLE